MRRILSIFLCLVLLVQPCRSAGQISAQCFVLMDGDSGEILTEKNAQQQCPIASITKLLTALTALESGHLPSEQVIITRESVGAEGSSIYLREGEVLTLEALLYGLLLKSGNDAALAIAVHCAGSTENFVACMNRKARELGMNNSHFSNPHGLHAEDHYSSACDMALLAKACLEQPLLAEIVASRYAAFGSRSFKNHNKLLWHYPGCIGMKTGYTEAAGRTLVSAARRGGKTLICVTLNAPDDWNDHTALLNHGFAEYVPVRLVHAGEQLGWIGVEGSLIPAVPVLAASELIYPLRKSQQPVRNAKWSVGQLKAPCPSGTKAGTLSFLLSGAEIGCVGLVTGSAVPDEHQEYHNPAERIRNWLKAG